MLLFANCLTASVNQPTRKEKKKIDNNILS